MGAVILQKDEKERLQPIAFLSKKFSETERNWAIWEKEAAAIKLALSTCRHWLEGSPHPFEVWSDNKNLLALRQPRRLTAKQIRWEVLECKIETREKLRPPDLFGSQAPRLT